MTKLKHTAFEEHMTPQKLARYFHAGVGEDVGRVYTTHGSMWEVPDSLIARGLLHLVVSELGQIRKSVTTSEPSCDDHLAAHRAWLNYGFHAEAINAIDCHEAECARIDSFCDLSLIIGGDTSRPSLEVLAAEFREYHVNGDWRARKYCGRYFRHVGLRELKKKIERLRRCRSLDDLDALYGIGEKKADKIRAKMLAASD